MRNNNMEEVFKAFRAYVLYIREDLGDTESPILMAIDSYAPLRINLDLENEAAMKDPIGYMAMQTNVKFNELLGKFVSFLEEHNATFVLINQLTHEYRSGPMGTQKVPKSLNEDKIAYYATQRIRGEAGRVDGSSKNIVKLVNSTSKHKEAIKKKVGIWVTWTGIKNRDVEPFQQTETRILWKSGIKPFSGLLEVLANRGQVELGTQKRTNKDGSTSKTPNLVIKLVGTDEKFVIGKKLANMKNKEVEGAIAELVEAHPELLKSEYYEHDRDSDDEYDED
jgi:hypothetical protein